MLLKTLNYLLLLLISHLFQDFFYLLFFLCKLGETPSQWEIEETVRFKEVYDQDKDGRLNRDEQLRWVAPNSYGSAREEVRFTYYTVCCFKFLLTCSINALKDNKSETFRNAIILALFTHEIWFNHNS